jgi:hypothetical protein
MANVVTRRFRQPPLTRLAALGTRNAGEGPQRQRLKGPLPHRGSGGTQPAGLGG